MTRRILFYTGSLASGGAERQMLYTALAAKERNYQVKVVIDYPINHYKEMIEGSGIEIECTHSTRFSPIKRYIVLSGAIRSFKPDIVHSFLATKNLWGMALSKMAGVPLKIASIRNTDADEFSGIRLYRRWADKIICNTKLAAEIAEKRYGVPSGKIMVVYNAIDSRPFSRAYPIKDLREKLGIKPDQRLGVTIARFAEQKNYLGLVDAVKILSDEGRLAGLHFIFVGHANNRNLAEEVKKKIQFLGLTGKISILGVRQDIPEILKTSDFMVLPSFYEGFPNVVLEAMASGVFVIATPTGGTPELVKDGKNGILAKGTNPSDLAEAIRKYLSIGDEKRKTIISFALEHVSSFDKGQAFEQIFSLYEKGEVPF